LKRTPVLPGAGRAPHPQGELSQISQIQFLATKKRTRVLLTLTGDTPYQFAELPAGKDLRRRIYVDLFQARPGPALASSYQVKSPHVSQVRLGRYDTFTTRLVLDVEQAGGFSVDHLLAAHGKKIIIDLYSKAEDVPAAASPGPQKEVAAPPAQHPGSMNLRQALGLKVRSIVIDPGHGGKDPGAVGFGLQEKDVALNIAKALRVEFQRQLPDIRVVLTRENDRFIPLDERPVLAKKLGGDLFVSIHLNAHEEERIQGVETYFLNLTADSSAIRVAARENFSTKKQVGELNTILRKLLRNTKIEESENLARKVQAAVVGGFGPRRKVRNLGVKQAPFMVLLGSEMPSVLVEAGFISNKKENKRLRDPKYIRGVAQGIFKGLRDYIQEPAFSAFNPTPDSTTAVAATPGP
ncbi:MAG: N-acetylmuramoyl-L-alanine amidase, partial [Deltaproteobacteria bacterium]|nr:N-acetylmuramoyl-L-alanine amidase [Deltaproteobacteria bacterium]